MNGDDTPGFPTGWRFWLLMVGVTTLIGLYNFSSFLAQYRMDQVTVPLRQILVNEMSGAYSFLLLLPLLLLFILRNRMGRDNWYRTLPLHLLAAVVFGVLQTTLMSLSRMILYPAFNLDHYRVGDLLDRYVMEFHKQLLVYILLVGAVEAWRRIRSARLREREGAALALRASRLQTQLSEARLQALQGRLQPHFLFNTLNMISAVMYEDAARADRMIARLSTLLRVSLETDATPCIPLRRELEILDVYLEIMRARFGSRLAVELDVDPTLEEWPVPALLLQPLVENAIRHGEPEIGEPVEITVRAVRDGGRLLLEVVDNGPGLPGGDVAVEGVGLGLVRNRLAQLYGTTSGLCLENRPEGGLRVRIELPGDDGKGAFGHRRSVETAGPEEML